jgi:hypothetical protein
VVPWQAISMAMVSVSMDVWAKSTKTYLGPDGLVIVVEDLDERLDKRLGII